MVSLAGSIWVSPWLLITSTISEEMPELIGMSNRIIVMCNGHITGEVEGEDATQEKIMSFATKFTLSGKENK